MLEVEGQGSNILKIRTINVAFCHYSKQYFGTTENLFKARKLDCAS